MKLIVLHSTKYGESSLIVHAYSQTDGRAGYMIKGAFGKKNQHLSASIHPLNIIDYQISPNNKASLALLKEFSSVRTLSDLRFDLKKNSIAIFICELLYRSLRENIQDPILFNFLESAIITLNDHTGDYSNFHLWFCIRFASVLGFNLSEEFSDEYNPFNTQQLEIIKLLNHRNFDDCKHFEYNGSLRKDFLDSIIRYLEFHLNIKLKINSLPILHSIWQ